MTDHRSKHTFITMTDIIKTDEPPKPIKLKPKQKKTIELYFDPVSETYGNLYKSALMAGFKPSYALNIANRNPLWLSETVESTLKLQQEHIIRGVQHIATKKDINSRSPDDTRLKAFETLGNWAGLAQNTGTTVNIVTPILGGDSAQHARDNTNTIDITETKPEQKS